MQDPADLWNTDAVQTTELFAGMVKGGEANCLADNRWSAVRCPGARRDPGLSAAGLGRLKPDQAPPPAKGVVAAIQDAAAGTSAACT